MDDRRDVAVIARVLVAATFLTIFFLKVAQPTGGIMELLFAQL